MPKPYLKAFCFAVWIGLWYLAVTAAKKLRKHELADRMILWCNRGILAIVSVQLTVRGEPAKERPLLLVSNHISYLDILLLGTQITVRFTPKSDIAAWPVVGKIAVLCEAIFVDRRPGMVKAMNQSIHKVLSENKVVALFPEATTGDGIHMEPFKPGAFSLADTPFEDGRHLYIQPVALTYTHIRKLPIDRTQWPDIAWYGDMDLVPHLMNLLALGPLQAEMVFLPPIEVKQEQDRKELATLCHKAISDAIQEIRGRQLPAAAPVPKIQEPPALQVRNG